MPLRRSMLVCPMPLPLVYSRKKVGMLRAFLKFFSDGSFALRSSKMIDDLMFKNSHQPGSFGASSFKFLVGFQCGEKCLLHCIFRRGIVTQPKGCVLEKIITVIVEPAAGIWRLVKGFGLCLAHIEPGLDANTLVHTTSKLKRFARDLSAGENIS